MPVHSRLRSLASFVLAFAALSSFAQSLRVHARTILENWTPEAVNRLDYGSEPVWRDEFNGEGLDRSKWDPKDQAWWDNGEQQYYTPDAVSVSGGTLKIRASNESLHGRPYTSGRIDTSQSTQFRYGLYAARIKSTYSQGIWPAWWMFGTGPKYSELDMFELTGGDPDIDNGDDSTYGALTHFSVVDMPTDQVTIGPGCVYKVPRPEKFADNFHVMWMEWTPTKVYMGLDDDQQLIVANISALDAFNAHMYMILNVAVGGDFPGDPNERTVLPQNLEVDWVRVWAKGGRGEDIMVHENESSSSSTALNGGSSGDGSTGTSGDTASSGSTGDSSSSSGGVPTGGSSSGSPSSSSSSGPSDGSSSDGSTSGGSSSGDGGGDDKHGNVDDNGATSALQASTAGGVLALIAAAALIL